MQISYFSPLLKLLPFSTMSMQIPFSSLLIKSSNPASFSKSITLSSEYELSISKLNFSVPVNMVGSQGITVTFFLRQCISTSKIFTSSIRISPSIISMILDKDRQIVLFPAPVLPTIPIFSPDLTSNVKSFRTTSVFGRYYKNTLRNSTLPSSGQSGLSLSNFESSSLWLISSYGTLIC